jgi:hypothetical protein
VIPSRRNEQRTALICILHFGVIATGGERGLIGSLICSHIENQFGFVLKQWMKDAAAHSR